MLYVLIECVTGTLPWAHLRGLQNLDKVRDMKLQYNSDKLVRGLPDAFLQVPFVSDRSYNSKLHAVMNGFCERSLYVCCDAC